MLAERRSRPALTGRRLTQTICKSELIGDACLRPARLADHVAGPRLWMLECFVERQHRFAATVGVAHQLYPLISRPRLENGPNFVKELCSPFSLVVLARYQVLTSSCPAEIRPEL